MRAHPDYGFEVVGFIDDDPVKQGAIFHGARVIGTSDDLLGIVREERIDEMVLALPWSEHDKMLQALEDTSREYLEVKVVPDLLEYIAIRASLEDLDGLPILNLADDPLHTWDWFLKRLFDVAASATGLLLLSPLLGLIALLVRRSSPGPILYRQERMGLDGKRFEMVKFRTMRLDAEAGTGPVFAAEEDPRATRVGGWLRRFSLDELPQLWNVLRGDMSIVGPRPERPSFVHEFKEKIPQYMLRHRMKSGITGWAQVNGWRGNTSITKRIEHDLYYVANWSLALDLKIVGLTLRALASLGRGAAPGASGRPRRG
jgi:exopolysaccharide biosynthesis polyprenyl glycosylphosphotransferase